MMGSSLQGRRLRGVGSVYHILAVSSAGFAFSWLVALLLGRVPLDYLGDEAGRILFSYEVSSPRSLASYLLSSEAWIQIHPPGDAAFKGLLNWIAGGIVHSPAGFIGLHQVAGWACTTGGLVFIVWGIRRRFGHKAATVGAALVVAASPTIYVGHHAIGENLAILLGGFAVYRVLARPITGPRDAIVSALPLAATAVVRPEAAVVFAAFALVPLWEGRWRAALTYVSVSIAPVGFMTALIETTTAAESYVSVRRFPRVPFFDVVFDERMREIIWGMGVLPFLGVAVVLVAVYTLLRRRVTLGVVLTAGWLGWAVVFTSQIAVGAIHRQERAYLFPALFGLVALAALASDWLGRLGGPYAGLIGFAVLVLLVVNAYGVWFDTYRSWQVRVPAESTEVSTWLDEHASPDGAILLDWMWWQEWRAAVYASLPGLEGPYCLYYRCMTDPDPELVADLVSRRTEIAAERLALAASFLREQAPRHVVMFSDTRYEEWLTDGPGRDDLTSFVRPLLQADGDCFRTLDRLGGRQYCPVLENAWYVVLERVR